MDATKARYFYHYAAAHGGGPLLLLANAYINHSYQVTAWIAKEDWALLQTSLEDLVVLGAGERTTKLSLDNAFAVTYF